MIGFYNLSVILTYLSAVCAVTGIFMSVTQNFNLAVGLFALGTVCDFFDGKVARCFDRSDEEKLFGVQIDSLCDVINNAVFPAAYFYIWGFRDPVSIIIFSVYVVCAVIRLAYFNVLETRDMSTHSDYFLGVPTTAIIVLMIILHIVKIFYGDFPKMLVQISMLALGISFILNIRVKKIGFKSFGFLLIIGLACYLKLLGIY